MSKLAQFINDVYEGLYYYAIKYESEKEAKRNLRLRMATTFFLYYFSLLLLLTVVRARVYGAFEVNRLEVIIIGFGIYFLLYRYFIEALIVASSFNDPPDERQRKIRLCLLVFVVSICFLIAVSALVYFTSKN